MNLCEIICSVFILSIFIFSLPDIIFPSIRTIGRITEKENEIQTAFFLSESFHKAVENKDINGWEKDCLPFADSGQLKIEKEKDTALLYKAECVVSKTTYVFYGVSPK